MVELRELLTNPEALTRSFSHRIISPLSFDHVIHDLELSLQSRHPALQPKVNPVLSGLIDGSISLSHGEWVLGQYCFFPARIVEILSALAFRLFKWRALHEELLENIAEECGLGTRQVPHIVILRDCILRELGMDLAEQSLGLETSGFLDSIISSIHKESRAFVAGMAYALEDSAIPELRIVAEIVNEVCRVRGDSEHLIHRHQSRTRSYAKELMQSKMPSVYTLEDFFVIHLLEIEEDHRDDLRNAIVRDLDPNETAVELEQGFEFVLSRMDEWWLQLAGAH